MFEASETFPEGWFSIKNSGNNYVLMPENGSTEVGTKIVLASARSKDADAQHWIYAGEGYIRNKKSGLVLDVAKGSLKAGSELTQQHQTTSDDQDNENGQLFGLSIHGHLFLQQKSSLVIGFKESFFSRREGLRIQLQAADQRQLDKKEQLWEVEKMTKTRPISRSSSAARSFRKSLNLGSSTKNTDEVTEHRSLHLSMSAADNEESGGGMVTSRVLSGNAFFLKSQSTGLFISGGQDASERLHLDSLRKQSYDSQLWTYDLISGHIKNKQTGHCLAIVDGTLKEDQHICQVEPDKAQSWVHSVEGELCVRDDSSWVVGVKDKWYSGTNRKGTHLVLQKKGNKSQQQRFNVVHPIFKKTENLVKKDGVFPDGWFFVKNQAHGLVLTVLDSGVLAAKIVAVSLDTGNYSRQLWKYDDGFLINKSSNWCLDVRGGSLVQDAELIQYKKKTSQNENQQWGLTVDGCVYVKGEKTMILSVEEDETSRSKVFLSKVKPGIHKEQHWNFVLPLFKKKQLAEETVKVVQKKVVHHYAQYPAGWFFIQSFTRGSTRDKPLVLTADQDESAIQLKALDIKAWQRQLWRFENGALVNYETNSAIAPNKVSQGEVLTLHNHSSSSIIHHWFLTVNGLLVSESNTSLTMFLQENKDGNSIILEDCATVAHGGHWGILIPEFTYSENIQVLLRWTKITLREWRRTSKSSSRAVHVQYAHWPEKTFYICNDQGMALVPSASEAFATLELQKLQTDHHSDFEWSFQNGYLVHCRTGLIVQAGDDTQTALVENVSLYLRVQTDKVDSRQMWCLKTDGSIVCESKPHLGLAFIHKDDKWTVQLVDSCSANHTSWSLCYGKFQQNKSILESFIKIILNARQVSKKQDSTEHRRVTYRTGVFPEGWFFIRSRANKDLVLTASGTAAGTKLLLKKLDTKSYQQQLWCYRDEGCLANKGSDLVIDCAGGKIVSGCSIIQWSEKFLRHSRKNQLWGLSSDGHIYPQSRPGLVLSSQGSAVDGGVLELHARGSLDNTAQQWAFATPIFRTNSTKQAGEKDAETVQTIQDADIKVVQKDGFERITKKVIVRRWGVFPQGQFFIRCQNGDQRLALTVDQQARDTNGKTEHAVTLQSLDYKAYKWHLWYFEDGHLFNVQTGLALEALVGVSGQLLEEGLKAGLLVRERSMDQHQFWTLGVNGELQLHSNERLVVSPSTAQRSTISGAPVGIKELRISCAIIDGKHENTVVSEKWHRWSFAVPRFAKRSIPTTIVEEGSEDAAVPTSEDEVVEDCEEQKLSVQETEESQEDLSDSEDEEKDIESESDIKDEQSQDADIDLEPSEATREIFSAEAAVAAVATAATAAAIVASSSATTEKSTPSGDEGKSSSNTRQLNASASETDSATDDTLSSLSSSKAKRQSKRASYRRSRPISYKLQEGYVPVGIEKVINYKSHLGTFPASDFFLIKSELHGYVLDVIGKTTDGAQVALTKIRTTDFAGQLWTFKDGYLTNVMNQNLVLDAAKDSLVAGERIHLSARKPIRDADDQQWEHTGENVIRLGAKRSLVLTVKEKQSANASKQIDVFVKDEKLHISRKDVRPEQRWEILIPVMIPLTDGELVKYRIEKMEEETSSVIVRGVRDITTYQKSEANPWPSDARAFFICFGENKRYLASDQLDISRVNLFALEFTLNCWRFLWVYVDGYLVNIETKRYLSLSKDNEWILSEKPLHKLLITAHGAISIIIGQVTYYLYFTRQASGQKYCLEASKDQSAKGIEFELPSYTEQESANRSSEVADATRVVLSEIASSSAFETEEDKGPEVVKETEQVVIKSREIDSLTKRVPSYQVVVNTSNKSTTYFIRHVETIILAWKIYLIQQITQCKTQQEATDALVKARTNLQYRLDRCAIQWSTDTTTDKSWWQVMVDNIKQVYDTKVIENCQSKLQNRDIIQPAELIEELDIDHCVEDATREVVGHIEQKAAEPESVITNITVTTTEKASAPIFETYTLEAVDKIKVLVHQWFVIISSRVIDAIKQGASKEDVDKIVQSARKELDTDIDVIQSTASKSVETMPDIASQTKKTIQAAVDDVSASIDKQLSTIVADDKYLEQDSWTKWVTTAKGYIDFVIHFRMVKLECNMSGKSNTGITTDSDTVDDAKVIAETQMTVTKKQILNIYGDTLRSIVWALEKSPVEDVEGAKRSIKTATAEAQNRIITIINEFVITTYRYLFISRRGQSTDDVEKQLLNVKKSILTRFEVLEPKLLEATSKKELLDRIQCSFGPEAETQVLTGFEETEKQLIDVHKDLVVDELEVGKTITSTPKVIQDNKGQQSVKQEQQGSSITKSVFGAAAAVAATAVAATAIAKDILSADDKCMTTKGDKTIAAKEATANDNKKKDAGQNVSSTTAKQKEAVVKQHVDQIERRIADTAEVLLEKEAGPKKLSPSVSDTIAAVPKGVSSKAKPKDTVESKETIVEETVTVEEDIVTEQPEKTAPTSTKVEESITTKKEVIPAQKDTVESIAKDKDIKVQPKPVSQPEKSAETVEITETTVEKKVVNTVEVTEPIQPSVTTTVTESDTKLVTSEQPKEQVKPSAVPAVIEAKVVTDVEKVDDLVAKDKALSQAPESTIKGTKEQVTETITTVVVKEEESQAVETPKETLLAAEDKSLSQAPESAIKETKEEVTETTTTVIVKEEENQAAEKPKETLLATEDKSLPTNDTKKAVPTNANTYEVLGAGVALVSVFDEVKTIMREWLTRLTFKVNECANESGNNAEGDIDAIMADAKKELDASLEKVNSKALAHCGDTGFNFNDFTSSLKSIRETVWQQTSTIKDIGVKIAETSDNADAEFKLDALTESTLNAVGEQINQYRRNIASSNVIRGVSEVPAIQALGTMVDSTKNALIVWFKQFTQRSSTLLTQGNNAAQENIDILAREAREQIAAIINDTKQKSKIILDGKETHSETDKGILTAEEQLDKSLEQVKERLLAKVVKVETIVRKGDVADATSQLDFITQEAATAVDCIVVVPVAIVSEHVKNVPSITAPVKKSIDQHSAVVEYESVRKTAPSSVQDVTTLVRVWLFALAAKVNDLLQADTSCSAEKVEALVSKETAIINEQVSNYRNAAITPTTEKSKVKELETALDKVAGIITQGSTQVKSISVQSTTITTVEEPVSTIMSIVKQNADQLDSISAVDKNLDVSVPENATIVKVEEITTTTDIPVATTETVVVTKETVVEETVVKEPIVASKEIVVEETVVEEPVVEEPVVAPKEIVVEEKVVEKPVVVTKVTVVEEPVVSEKDKELKVTEQSQPQSKTTVSKTTVTKSETTLSKAEKPESEVGVKDLAAGAAVAAAVATAITVESHSTTTPTSVPSQPTKVDIPQVRISVSGWLVLLYEKISTRVKNGGYNVYSDIVAIIDTAEKNLNDILKVDCYPDSEDSQTKQLVVAQDEINTHLKMVREAAWENVDVENSGMLIDEGAERLLLVCEDAQGLINRAIEKLTPEPCAKENDTKVTERVLQDSKEEDVIKPAEVKEIVQETPTENKPAEVKEIVQETITETKSTEVKEIVQETPTENKSVEVKEIVQETITEIKSDEGSKLPESTPKEIVVPAAQKVQAISPSSAKDISTNINSWFAGLLKKLAPPASECIDDTKVDTKVDTKAVLKEAQDELETIISQAKAANTSSEEASNTDSSDRDVTATLETIQSVVTKQIEHIGQVADNPEHVISSAELQAEIENTMLVSQKQVERALAVHVAKPESDTTTVTEKELVVIVESKEQAQDRLRKNIQDVSAGAQRGIVEVFNGLITGIRNLFNSGATVSKTDIEKMIQTAQAQSAKLLSDAKRDVMGDDCDFSTTRTAEVDSLVTVAEKQVLDSLDFVKKNVDTELKVLGAVIVEQVDNKQTLNAKELDDHITLVMTQAKEQAQETLTRSTDIAVVSAFEGKRITWTETTVLPSSFERVRVFAFDIFGAVVDFHTFMVREWQSKTAELGDGFKAVDANAFILRWYNEFKTEKNKTKSFKSDDDIFRTVLLRLLKENHLGSLPEAKISELCVAWKSAKPFHDAQASVKQLKSQDDMFAVAFSPDLSMRSMMELARNGCLCWHAQFAPDIFGAPQDTSASKVIQLMSQALSLDSPDQLAIVSTNPDVLDASKKQGAQTVYLCSDVSKDTPDINADITLTSVADLAESYSTFAASKTVATLNNPRPDKRSWFQKVVDATIEALS